MQNCVYSPTCYSSLSYYYVYGHSHKKMHTHTHLALSFSKTQMENPPTPTPHPRWDARTIQLMSTTNSMFFQWDSSRKLFLCKFWIPQHHLRLNLPSKSSIVSTLSTVALVISDFKTEVCVLNKVSQPWKNEPIVCNYKIKDLCMRVH